MRQRAPLVLVITGSAKAAETICGELRQASYTAALAGDGRSALRAAAQDPPALIVSELELTDMDGAMMLRALRQLPGLAGLPAIGLDGLDGSPPAGGPTLFEHTLARPLDARRLIALTRELVGDCAPGHDRPHVLLVQRDEGQRQLAMVCLRHAGYEVTATTGAAEALELSRRRTPDAVVSEVRMPAMDGYELARELRRDARTRDLPIILTCSPVEPVDLERVTSVGASALIMHTPDLGDLVDAIRSRLDSPPARAPSAVVPAGDGEATARRLQQLIASNAEMRQRLAAQSMELAFLAEFGAGISAGADADQLLTEVLTRCAEVTGFAYGAAYLAFPDAPPVLQGHVGFTGGERLHDFFGDLGLLLEALQEAAGRVVRLPSEHLDGARVNGVLRRAGLATMLVAPVSDTDALAGMLVLGSTRTDTTLAEEMLIAAISSQTGRWLGRARCAAGLSRWQRHTVERLTRAAEFRDEETASHTERVGRYCGLLATLSGMDPRRSELIAAASAMHDIGKLGIPDSILHKAGPLTATERIHMQRHAEYGRRILAGESDPLLDLAAIIAWTHHERWDGGGYPRGISGREIPVEGRIVAIGDVFDALTSDRIYRPAMTIERALREMETGRGSQFDPHLLDLFVQSLPQVLEIRRRLPDLATDSVAPYLSVS